MVAGKDKLESFIPVVRYYGLKTDKSVVFTGAVSLSGTTTLTGTIIGYATSVQSNQGPTVAATYAVNQTIFVNDNVTGTYKIVGVSATFGTASTSGTVNVEVATGTQAIASGTNQMSSALVLSGTANTPVNGTITTQTTIAAGSRVNLIFAGTVTNLAAFSINVILQKIS